MILFLTNSFSSVNDIVPLLEERKIEYYRLDMDSYWKHRFTMCDDRFEIISEDGKEISSKTITEIVLFKGQMFVEDPFPPEKEIDSPKWVHATLNYILLCLVRWGIEHRMLKLWTPYELLYPKTFQMERAKRYFPVPSYCIHWGYELESAKKIVKPLQGRPMDNGAFLYAQVLDVTSLSADYPWFTQDVADGNRDMTVLFINGRVHCFQFATERGELTDWRVTQGTEINRWVPWEADDVFEAKIRAYMNELGLKYGRLDFIVGGKEPQFLEVNPCGQFGWLDDESMTLHREIVDAILEPSSVITL